MCLVSCALQFFRAMFPFVLVASLCTAAWQYCDMPTRHWAVLKALLSTNRVLTERTQELIRATCMSLFTSVCRCLWLFDMHFVVGGEVRIHPNPAAV